MIPYFLANYRTLWLRGRPGGGKTSLAIHLAKMLCEGRQARFIAANIPLTNLGPLVWTGEDPLELRKLENMVIILDESYHQLDMGSSSKSLQTWLGTIRHRNQYLILPSVLELNRQTRAFTAQRLFNGLLIGLPMWLYRWEISNGGTRDRGFWSWWNPRSVFGNYNHRPIIGQFDKGLYHVYYYRRPKQVERTTRGGFRW